jgi:triacylglycerol lipase
VIPLDYAILARRAYTDSPTIGRVDGASRMHIYGAPSGDVHVFRGSDDLESWAHDFNIAVENVPGLGLIHAGFWTAWQAIREQCLALPMPSAIAGHSLGAALAIICAAEWAMQGHIVPVYAFEPPRLCGDSTLFHRFLAWDNFCYATRNGHDLVTQVPSLLSFPFPLIPIGMPLFPIDNMADHSIDRVITALAEANHG